MAKGNGKKGRRTGRNDQKPKPWEPEPRELEIYAHVVEGQLSMDEIGKKYDLNKGNVCRLAQRIDAWLIPQWMDDIRKIKARHTESLLHVFREAMRAWERSKEDEVIFKTEDVVVEGRVLDTGKETVTRKKQAGNPAFLAQARAALADIRKIWGADEPVEHHHSGEIRVAGLSRQKMYEELSKRYDAMASGGMN